MFGIKSRTKEQTNENLFWNNDKSRTRRRLRRRIVANWKKNINFFEIFGVATTTDSFMFVFRMWISPIQVLINQMMFSFYFVQSHPGNKSVFVGQSSRCVSKWIKIKRTKYGGEKTNDKWNIQEWCIWFLAENLNSTTRSTWSHDDVRYPKQLFKNTEIIADEPVAGKIRTKLFWSKSWPIYTTAILRLSAAA